MLLAWNNKSKDEYIMIPVILGAGASGNINSTILYK